MKILTPHEQIVVHRQSIALLQSPQGRDLGRVFLAELGKGEDGSLGAVTEEVLSILHDAIFELYASPAPVQGR